MKSLIITAVLMLCIATTTHGETRSDNWSIRFAPGVGIGIPSGRSFGSDPGLMLRFATDVHLFGGLVLRAPFVAHVDDVLGSDGQNMSVRGSIGPLFRARLTKNPRFPSELYLYTGFGIINLSPARSGETWTIADFSIGLQPALSSWLSLDFGYDLPLMIILKEGKRGRISTLSGPRFGVVLGL